MLLFMYTSIHFSPHFSKLYLLILLKTEGTKMNLITHELYSLVRNPIDFLMYEPTPIAGNGTIY